MTSVNLRALERELMNGFSQSVPVASSQEVSDEALAAFACYGIDGVPAEERDAVLRAIAESPILAALVADVAESHGMEGAPPSPILFPRGSVWGLKVGAWRVAQAACLVLAVTASILYMSQPTSPESVQLLVDDSSSPALKELPSQSIWSHTSTLAVLWAMSAVLTIPAFVARSRTPVQPRDRRSRGGF